MKEVFFRAKTSSVVTGFNNIEDNNWVFGFYRDKVGLPIISHFDNTRADYVDYEVNPQTRCQYIALMDRRGKCIFENDIIEFYSKNWRGDIDKEHKYKGVIEWDSYYCCWLIDGIGCGTFMFGRDVELRNCMVIGNRFDNPELLEG